MTPQEPSWSNRLQESADKYEENFHNLYPDGMTVADYCNRDIPSTCFLAGSAWAIAQLGLVVEAILKENPSAEGCKHDYEPNTTLDYFRCDKCGIRPRMAEAIALLREMGVGEGG